MKVFLPFKIKDIGGTSTFAAKFKAGMEAQGHTVTTEFCEDYDILFLIVQCPLRYLLHAKRTGKKIVQRLDGTYYWSVASWKFPLYNAKAAYTRHFFTDFTIYQSRYSQESAEHFLGKKRRDPSAIIFNGADLNIFSPNGKKKQLRDTPRQKIFFTASAFRRKDQIEPLIEAAKVYRRTYGSNFKLVVAGNFISEVSNLPVKYSKRRDVQFLGKIKNADLPAYARASDAFVFTHLNPPCPNNIIEAMACGLPICGLTDGAMSEIVRDSQDGLLLKVEGSGYWRSRPFDAKKFAHNMSEVIKNKKIFAQNSRDRAENDFSLNGMITAYVKVLQSLVE